MGTRIGACGQMSAPTERERVIAERALDIVGQFSYMLADTTDARQKVAAIIAAELEKERKTGYDAALEAAAQMLEGLSQGSIPIDERMTYRVSAQAIRSLKEGEGDECKG